MFERLYAQDTSGIFRSGFVFMSGRGDEVLRAEHVVWKSILYRELSVMMKRVRWKALQERNCGCEPT